MSHFRNFTIICLSLLVVGLAKVALRPASLSSVETAYAGSGFCSSPSEDLSPPADDLQPVVKSMEAAPWPAAERPLTPVMDYKSIELPQNPGNPWGLSSAATLPIPWFITDLDAASSRNGSHWQATVTVTVVNCLGNPATHANVFGSWGNGRTISCTTDSTGRCTLTSPEVEASQNDSLTFTVNNLIHSEPSHYLYQASRNTDPDGDSDGTMIVINQP